MKKTILILVSIIGATLFIQAQTSDFDGTDGLSLTTSGGSTLSGSSGIASPSGGMYGNPNNGFVVNNGTGTVTTGTIVTSTTSSFTFDLASLSGSSGNGAESSDDVMVEVSTDGGTTFTTVTTVTGSSSNNARWTYSGGTTASNSFTTPGATFAPGGGGVRDDDGDGIESVEVTDIPTGNIVVRITLSNNSGNEYWAIDNLELTSAGGATDPTVQFTSTTYNVNEGDGTSNMTICVSITNPNASPTTVDVALTGGTATNGTDISSYTTEMLTFPANSSDDQCISITLTDDSDLEGTETLEFTLQNANNLSKDLVRTKAAMIGTPSMATVSIADNDNGPSGAVIFQMINPCGNDGDNEFVVLSIDGDTNIDDIAIGSRSDDADTNWNFFWNTVNSNVGEGDLDATTTTAMTSYDLLDPNIAADNTIITDRLTELNSAAVVGSNTGVFKAVPATGIIPGGSTVILFLGAGTSGTGSDGFDDAANNLPFSDASYNNACIYAVFGNGTQNGFFSNSNTRTQFLSINGNVSMYTYMPSGGEAGYVFADGAYNSDDVDCIPPLQALLPVELLSFTGKLVEGETVLNWATASETNNSHFEVERSFDGKSFKQIGQVQGNGTTLEAQTYGFVDVAPQTGVNYYRLKQVDFDGTYAYSDIVAIAVASDDKFNVTAFPSPTAEQLTIAASSTIESVQIWDMTGRLVQELQASTNTLDVDVSTLASGNYFARVQSNGKVELVRFVKE